MEEDIQSEVMMVVLGLFLMERYQTKKKKRLQTKILKTAQKYWFLFTPASLFFLINYILFYVTTQGVVGFLHTYEDFYKIVGISEPIIGTC